MAIKEKWQIVPKKEHRSGRMKIAMNYKEQTEEEMWFRLEI